MREGGGEGENKAKRYEVRYLTEQKEKRNVEDFQRNTQYSMRIKSRIESEWQVCGMRSSTLLYSTVDIIILVIYCTVPTTVLYST